MRLGLAAATVIALGGIAAAQHQHGDTPYAGLHQRAIKALSEQQIADLRAGRGMGLAFAAELNGYPGPVHVIELADQLQLTDDQRRRTRELFEAMKAEALPIGEQLIEPEKVLVQAFAEQSISPGTVAEMTAQIGETQGRLRSVHLKYHLTMADLLTAHQKELYAGLRGYR